MSFGAFRCVQGRSSRVPLSAWVAGIGFGLWPAVGGTREAIANNQKLKLSPKEFDLLLYLFKNRERVVPRDELLSRVWNYRVDLNLNSRTVDTHVTRLRRKLQKAVGTDAAVIIAVAKIGYRYLGSAVAA